MDRWGVKGTPLHYPPAKAGVGGQPCLAAAAGYRSPQAALPPARPPELRPALSEEPPEARWGGGRARNGQRGRWAAGRQHGPKASWFQALGTRGRRLPSPARQEHRGVWRWAWSLPDPEQAPAGVGVDGPYTERPKAELAPQRAGPLRRCSPWRPPQPSQDPLATACRSERRHPEPCLRPGLAKGTMVGATSTSICHQCPAS